MAPRGRPKTGKPWKQVLSARLPPELIQEVRRRTSDVSTAVEEGLGLWLSREKRRDAAKAKPRPARTERPPPPKQDAATDSPDLFTPLKP
jgi:hypothetical protein